MSCQPCIVGVDDGHADNSGKNCLEIAATAARGALADAGLGIDDVDGVLAAYAWEEPSMMFASQLADYLGVEPGYAETVCFGGASPAMMVARAARAIKHELCEVAVIAAASNRASKLGRAGAISALRDVLDPEFEIPFGAFIPPIYALTAARYAHDWGITMEQLAAVAVTQREHARLNPTAAFRDPITVADVLASPLVASPLHLLDCCLITDFGAAAVVADQSRSRSSDTGAVPILGVGEAHGRLTTGEVVDLTCRGAAASGPIALAQAGVTMSEIDFMELYDSFTITVICTLEDLGCCPKGTAGKLAVTGELGPGGRLPVNTNGGMLSYRTGGLSHVIEAVRQLRGDASGGTVSDAKLGLVHGVGGTFSSHCTLVLGAP